MPLRRTSSIFILLAACAPACVTETISESVPVAVERFRWDVPSLPAGVYRGVRIQLEVDPQEDLSPAERAHMQRDLDEDGTNMRLPPDPQTGQPPLRLMLDGQVEILRYKDLHLIEFYNGTFHVGDASFSSRFFPQPRATLFVFKRRSGNFRFFFRGQEIIVAAPRSWIPAVYYYAEDIGPDGQSADPGAAVSWVRETVKVGSSVIETDPLEGFWEVDARRYQPDPSTPLELRVAVRLYGARP